MKKLCNLFAVEKNGKVVADVLGHDPVAVREKLISRCGDRFMKLKTVMVLADYDLMDRYLNASRYGEPGCFMTITTDATGFSERTFFETLREAQRVMTEIQDDESVQLYSITHQQDGRRIFRELYSRVVLTD